MTARKRKPGRPALPARKRATETLSIRLYREDLATLRELTASGGSASEVVRAGLEALPRLLICAHQRSIATGNGLTCDRCGATNAGGSRDPWQLPERLRVLRDAILAAHDD